jgi:chromosome segregation ATPase
MKRLAFIGLIVVVALLAAACGKPPEAQIQEARNALQVAEQAGAPKYAPEAWTRALESRQALDAELEAQNGKIGLFRNYNKVGKLADQLAQAAGEAASAATRKTAELRTELTGTISELRNLLQTTRSRLSALPRTARVDITALRGRLNAAGERIDQAQRSLDGSGYDEAMARASEARDMIRAVLRSIETASPQTPSKKR